MKAFLSFNNGKQDFFDNSAAFLLCECILSQKLFFFLSNWSKPTFFDISSKKRGKNLGFSEKNVKIEKYKNQLKKIIFWFKVFVFFITYSYQFFFSLPQFLWGQRKYCSCSFTRKCHMRSIEGIAKGCLSIDFTCCYNSFSPKLQNSIISSGSQSKFCKVSENSIKDLVVLGLASSSWLLKNSENCYHYCSWFRLFFPGNYSFHFLYQCLNQTATLIERDLI